MNITYKQYKLSFFNIVLLLQYLFKFINCLLFLNRYLFIFYTYYYLLIYPLYFIIKKKYYFLLLIVVNITCENHSNLFRTFKSKSMSLSFSIANAHKYGNSMYITDFNNIAIFNYPRYI